MLMPALLASWLWRDPTILHTYLQEGRRRKCVTQPFLYGLSLFVAQGMAMCEVVV